MTTQVQRFYQAVMAIDAIDPEEWAGDLRGTLGIANLIAASRQS